MTTTQMAILTNCIKRIQLRMHDVAPYLNSGGCGFFGVCLIKQLDKIGVEYEIVITTRNSLISFALIEKNLRDMEMANNKKEKIPFLFNHVLIKVKNIYFDGQFAYDYYPHKFGRELGTIGRKQLELVVERGLWNKGHDHKLNSKVKYVVSSRFKELRNNFTKN